jgi:hypothetical protein
MARKRLRLSPRPAEVINRKVSGLSVAAAETTSRLTRMASGRTIQVMARVSILVAMVAFACCLDGCNGSAKCTLPLATPDAAVPRDRLDVDNLVFDDPANWIDVDGYVLKASPGTDQYAYLKQSTSGNTSLRIEMHVEWHSSADLTGIILRTSDDPSNKDGYYFLVYPYQDAYKILKVVNGTAKAIEEADCQSNASSGWQSLAVKASIVQVSGQSYNRFDFFASDQLATSVQDNSFSSWHLGFGKYAWYSSTEGYALFSNISEP